MRKFLTVSLVLITMLATFSCTDNQRARNLGGTMKINVEHGYKVTMATWKGENLFYMIEKMDSSYVPTEKILVEDASWGIVETKVKFIESR